MTTNGFFVVIIKSSTFSWGNNEGLQNTQAFYPNGSAEPGTNITLGKTGPRENSSPLNLWTLRGIHFSLWIKSFCHRLTWSLGWRKTSKGLTKKTKDSNIFSSSSNKLSRRNSQKVSLSAHEHNCSMTRVSRNVWKAVKRRLDSFLRPA